MPPTVALLLWFVLLLALMYFDPAKVPETSPALWVPVIWMFFIASFLPSQWLGTQVGTAAQTLEEGNPLDRAVFSMLILLAIGILVSRSFHWGGFFARNAALMAFLAFALVSVVWSDFPFIALKRWIRDLGNYLVILVVLTDPRSLEAVRTVLRRLCYLLIPLSILLIKYYPAMGRQYGFWEGRTMYTGATTSKNMLGALCLVSGIYFFWDTVTRWPDPKERRTTRILLVNLALIGMTLWLLHLSNSATSGVCLVIGCLVILATRSKLFKRHPGFLKALIPLCFLLYLIVAFGFDANAALAGIVGRDATLTDRTVIWQVLLSAKTNPLVGTGYESFWLGPRLLSVWRVIPGINEAHNGYLDIYLNLGLIGVALLCIFLITAYRRICRTLTTSLSLASLGLTIWTILLFYNVTEAAFKSGLLWLTLLLGAISVPARAEEQVPDIATRNNPRAMTRLSGVPLEISNRRR